MSLAPKRRGYVNGDPQGSEAPRGKARHQRKSRFDPGWTPTEKRQRDQLMRQFLKGGDGGRGNSPAYISSAVWCACGRGMNRRGKNGKTVPCARCAPKAKVAA